MFDVFEQPWGLLIIAGVAGLILLILRTVAPQKCRWWLWLLPAVLAVAAFGFDYLVETDREKINAVISIAVEGVENEDPDSIEMLIADDYRDSYHGSKDALMAHCEEMLSEPLFGKNIKRIVSIDIKAPEATVIFTVRVLFDPQSYVYQGFKQQLLAEVQADMRKQPDKSWLIRRTELLRIDFMPAGWQYTEQANQ
jgi:hypothetical protein